MKIASPRAGEDTITVNPKVKYRAVGSTDIVKTDFNPLM
jgi:hypothetical protein